MKVDSKMKDISGIYYISRMHSMLREFEKVFSQNMLSSVLGPLMKFMP
jgi:hypothetical protein